MPGLTRILIAGDSGLLGQAFVRHFAARPGREVLGLSTGPFEPNRWRPALPSSYRHIICDMINQVTALEELVQVFKPSVIINCAALADVNKCEAEPLKARALNVELPGRLAKLASEIAAKMVHISTDQVFDGKADKPYTVKYSPNPVHEYGRTKLGGEDAALNAFHKTLVLRTNIIGFRDRGAPTFGEWLCDALYLAKPITLYSDFVTNPLHVKDFAHIAEALIELEAAGLYNLGSHSPASKYEFGAAVAKALDVSMTAAKKGSVKDSPLNPPRPPYLALDMKETEMKLGYSLPAAENAAIELAAEFRQRQQKESAYVPH